MWAVREVMEDGIQTARLSAALHRTDPGSEKDRSVSGYGTWQDGHDTDRGKGA